MGRGAAGRTLAGAMLAVTVTVAGCQSRTPATEDSRALRTERCVDISDATARCHRLSVYENQTTRRGRTISLRIVVLPATGEDKASDAVVYLAGGPGQAATELIGDALVRDERRAPAPRCGLRRPARDRWFASASVSVLWSARQPAELLRCVPADREGAGRAVRVWSRAPILHNTRRARRSKIWRRCASLSDTSN